MWKTIELEADESNEPYGFIGDFINSKDIVTLRYKDGISGRRDRFFQCVATCTDGGWDYRVINATTRKDITHKFDIEIT
jgi:hypothetical protein